MDRERISALLAVARAEGRDALTELEGLTLLESLGLALPRHVFVKGSKEAEPALGGTPPFPGERAVVKVISPEILHKTDVGGVAIVRNDCGAILEAIRAMEAKFKKERVDGYTVNEFVKHDEALGHEMIVGYRFARDFGPIVSFGPGGIYAEYLASAFREGSATLFFSPATASRALIERELSHNVVRALASGGLRNTKPAIAETAIVDVIETFVKASPFLAAAGVSEFEVNPFVISRPADGPSRLVALDVLVKLGDNASGGIVLDKAGRMVNRLQAARPVRKIDKLLQPQSAAVMGVSEKSMNNGRIILRNLIENGFDTSRLYVVKPGASEIEGCACFPDIASLPERVDLFVLVIPAAHAAGAIAELAELDKAESVIVIPGGFEEKEGTEEIVSRMRTALEASRSFKDGGPIVNGGNCLGIRSLPGHYNTLFIPEYKLPMPKGLMAPIALISQSGAFTVSRISKHQNVNPKYMITLGNQMDVTIGDYLERLALDEEIEVFAVYVEGFKPLDGEKTLAAAKKIVDSGRSLIVYRAGRTAAGAKASASHTASIAGDYSVTKALFTEVGAVLVDSLEEFDEALTTFALLRGKPCAGKRLGAVSNAGFECVAIADNLGSLELARFAPETEPRLVEAFKKARISEIVDVHNPIDLTPTAGDDAYDETFRAVLDDPNVDCGIVGIVPLTSAMNTLAAGEDSYNEDILRPDSLAVRYGELMGKSEKPWVAVVDAGRLYDALAYELEGRGVPVFRTADRALKMLNKWVAANSGRR
jgi:acyl-CoA synthetase (NDP forming)